MNRYRFTLYVAGDTARSQQAYATLRQICRERLAEACDIEVVDVVLAPEAADRARVLTTPTVVREAPEPRRRITGDLGDAARVLQGLGIFPGRADTPLEDAR